jgi:hypothetical protein
VRGAGKRSAVKAHVDIWKEEHMDTDIAIHFIAQYINTHTHMPEYVQCGLPSPTTIAPISDMSPNSGGVYNRDVQVGYDSGISNREPYQE